MPHLIHPRQTPNLNLNLRFLVVLAANPFNLLYPTNSLIGFSFSPRSPLTKPKPRNPMFGACIRDLDLDLRIWLEGIEIKEGFKVAVKQVMDLSRSC
jgi:hypothetical protein